MRGLNIFIGVILGVFSITGGIKTQPGQAYPLDQEPIQLELVRDSQASGNISKDVLQEMETLGPSQLHTVIITLASSANLDPDPPSPVPMVTNNPVRQLQTHARLSQASLLQYLKGMEAVGRVRNIKPFWIFNGVAVTASPRVIQELGNRPDVLKIDPNRTFYAPSSTVEETSPLSNLLRIQAPALWEMGFRGQGVVVANMDTGVLGNHPDLVSSWRGGENSWFDATGQYPDHPFDTDGHGTWTMGVMVGGDSSGQALGVAPGAEWIAVRIFDDDGLATSVRIHQGFEWLLDPDSDPDTMDAPQVINSSWAFQSTGCFLDFQADIQALRAAGILPIFAAGNAGPSSYSGLSPSNNPGAFSVGSIDDRDIISLSSSRGPSLCDQVEQSFPSVVTPGIGILSTGLNNGYTSSSGTSLAAPHVAGALALLLSAFPDLGVDDQERILIESAYDLGLEGPDNDYGFGKLDVLNAYRLLAGQPVPPAQPGNPIGQTNGEILFLPVVSHNPRD